MQCQALSTLKLYDMAIDPFEEPQARILWVLKKAGVTTADLSRCYFSKQPAWFYLKQEVEGQVWEVELLPSRKKIYADALEVQREHENRLVFIHQETLAGLMQVDTQNALPVLSIITDYLAGDVSLKIQISLDDSEWDELSTDGDVESDWDRQLEWN